MGLGEGYFRFNVPVTFGHSPLDPITLYITFSLEAVLTCRP